MRDTYKFWFKIGNLRVHCGITDDLKRREIELQNSGKYTKHNGKKMYWSNGHISQEGNKTTREAAQKWKKENILKIS